MTRFLLSLCVALLFSKCSLLPVDVEKQGQVEDLVKQIPIHQSFREVGKHPTANANSLLVTKYCRSDADYEAVKAYYKEVMTQRGWRLVDEQLLRNWAVDYGGRSITFIKGEFLFSIQYEGKGNPEVRRDYALDYGWDSTEFRTRVRRPPLN